MVNAENETNAGRTSGQRVQTSASGAEKEKGPRRGTRRRQKKSVTSLVRPAGQPATASKEDLIMPHRPSEEGLIAGWSVPIRDDSRIDPVEERLRGFRRALEEQYMIGKEEASERLLLDLALNAVRDRILIHRIRPLTADLQETELLLGLRRQADCHVVEMLTALKSA